MLIGSHVRNDDPLAAAQVDGANWWQMYARITMPYIFFVLTPYLIVTFTANINNFNVIYLLSNGAPQRVGESAGQTDLLITWLYKPENYRLLLTQIKRNAGSVSGTVQARLVGGGSSVVLPVGDNRFTFQYFQSLTGEWQLPEGFRPERVERTAIFVR